MHICRSEENWGYGGLDVIYLDPYLSTRLERRTENKPLTRHVRMMPSPVEPASITNAGFIICSHNHGDHLDPETIVPMLQASPGARLVIPPAAVNAVKELRVQDECIFPVGAGDHAEFDGFTIEAVPGKHNEFDFDPDTGYPYVGYIMNFNGVTVYHAGDTVYYDGLEEKLGRYSIDIALLPVNGGDRDRVGRGFMSNLQFWESADLAAAIKARLVIPTHFDMFTINTENIERFEYYMDRKYPDIKYIVPKIGEKMVYTIE
jgi:L-ascorbate 6-phosphate lactonase